MSDPRMAQQGSQTLLDLFDTTAARFPHRPAVSRGTARLTYAELRSEGQALTRALLARGVRPGDRVVLYLRRGIDVFVGMLGVLRAGAAYVAIDTRYPDTRRDLMIKASRPVMVITEAGWANRIGELGPRVAEWDDLDDPEEAAEVATPVVRPADPASVLFTSGSTGTPKAVVLEHRNLVYLAGNPGVPLSADDRTGQVSSVSFDAFHFEAWCSLARGAEVVVLPSIVDLISSDIQRELRRNQITALLAPTMAVNHLVFEDRDSFASLRFLCTGGDVLQPSACRQLLAGAFKGAFQNLYGPAEATTACTGYLLDDLPPDARSVPIGVPLEHARVYVLDADLRAVPPDTTGEIYIGGSGVARGYLDQPALTAERFLPDPFDPSGGRMYATGDFGRRRADGQLEFVGRIDDQVKIRGYRVEPSEVERALAGHRSVREAAVIATGEAHDKRLVAVVVAAEPVALSTLREFAAQVLPDYMVPSSFLTVPSIPGNDHGKRDLVALRELVARDGRRLADRVPPRDELERYVAKLWEDMLGVDRIGREDDFFDLGGNSLQAFRLQRRINRELDVSVDPRQIIVTSRLADLAELIRGVGLAAR